MNHSEIKKNQIVVVINGDAYGNKAGTVTKVLGKPGEVNDAQMFEYYGKRIPDEKDKKPWMQFVQCEKVNTGSCGGTYKNIPSVYEVVTDLRPATEEEKKQYRKHRKQFVKQIIK